MKPLIRKGKKIISKNRAKPRVTLGSKFPFQAFFQSNGLSEQLLKIRSCQNENEISRTNAAERQRFKTICPNRFS
ncbi:hypothetical protein LEP1GSC060_1853 [Leptospira weilii serovar Ranarum str. ICFT]|uniref:Uncharacterized protein n=1 Tax=Leptospira weilii serovar Ranarum str. ICFT TaxID=1218598 RepID=N1WLB8_9LEPT|nr:hypothetical protein LEP1GSC060_1853 [Leptospira weilii serovar Ranarum str. ICFT]